MSKTTIIARMRREDGVARVVEVLPDGTERLFPDTPMRPMGEAELAAAAARDPDARPFTPEELAKAKRIPRAKTLRRALGLTQEEFAARYRIPLGTLRDWEQGRSEPDQTARAYLTVIAHNPEGVRRALEAKPGQTMPAPKVAEGEAFAPDIEERHPQEIRGFDWLLLVRRLSGGESDKMPSGNSSMKSAGVDVTAHDRQHNLKARYAGVLKGFVLHCAPRLAKMESIFSLAARRTSRTEGTPKFRGRAGELKMLSIVQTQQNFVGQRTSIGG